MCKSYTILRIFYSWLANKKIKRIGKYLSAYIFPKGCNKKLKKKTGVNFFHVSTISLRQCFDSSSKFFRKFLYFHFYLFMRVCNFQTDGIKYAVEKKRISL